MTLTRTDDKLDKNITRLLMQSPLGLTIGDITAEAKCTPQTARKSLARIGAEKDASGMLYVLRDDDEQAAPAPDPAPDVPAPEQAAPDPAPAAAKKPIRRGDLVKYQGKIFMVISKGADPEGDYTIASLTGEPDFNWVKNWAKIDELTRIGSIRKKVKRIKKEMEGRNAT